MANASRRTGCRGGRPVPVIIAGLLLAACSGSLDIDPSTIGGAEPEELVGDDSESREPPTLIMPDNEDDARVARPDDLDALAVRDVDDPWYLAAGTTRDAVGEVVEGRLAERDHDAICAYVDQEIDRHARERLRVPTADTAYRPDDASAARRLTERAVLDLLDEQFGILDLRVASSVTEACDLLVDLERARIAARGSLTRALDLHDPSYVDPRDDGWSAVIGVEDGGGDEATGRPLVADGPRDARVLAAWQEQLAPHTDGLCTWAGALPVPRDLDTALTRLVQLRTGIAHDGLPSATEALAATCPALDSLDWSAPARSAVEEPTVDEAGSGEAGSGEVGGGEVGGGEVGGGEVGGVDNGSDEGAGGL